jgi:hypothetical protein
LNYNFQQNISPKFMWTYRYMWTGFMTLYCIQMIQSSVPLFRSDICLIWLRNNMRIILIITELTSRFVFPCVEIARTVPSVCRHRAWSLSSLQGPHWLSQTGMVPVDLHAW